MALWDLRSTKTHPRAAAIRIDQLHARRFKGALDDVKSRPPGQGLPRLEQPNCHHPYPRLVGQMLLVQSRRPRAARHCAGVSMFNPKYAILMFSARSGGIKSLAQVLTLG